MMKVMRALSWSEFRLVWVLLAMLIAAFVVDVIVVPSAFLLLVEGGLLACVFLLTCATIYRAGKIEFNATAARTELDGILENSDDAIVAYGPNFQVIFFNPAAERLFLLHAKSVVDHVLKPQD